MSGFEIAGVILGAYPIIMSLLETYKATKANKGAIRLARDLRAERLIFEDFVDLLVTPHVSDKEQAYLKTPASPNLALWKSTTLQKNLRTLLGEEKADTVIEILKEIRALLKSLQEELAPRDQGIELLRRFRARIRLVRLNLPQSSLTSCLDDLTGCNVRLQRLITGHSLPLASKANYKRPRPPKRYLRRDAGRAVDLYRAVCDGYRCNCDAPHLANFSLPKVSECSTQDDASAKDRQYELLFAVDYSASGETTAAPSPELEDWTSTWSQDTAIQQKPANATRRVEILECKNLNNPELSQSILDLCIFIKTFQSDDTIPRSHIGFLNVKEKQYQLQIPSTSHKGTSQQIECLDQILKDRDFLLSRRERISLALSLSHAILSLYSTPWIEACWTWKDFCIDRNDDGQLFATRKFYSSNGAGLIPDSCGTLVSEFWVIHGEPTLTRLGFALIELALGKRLSELRSDMTFRSSDLDMLDFLTAKFLLDSGRISQAESKAYEDVVRVCLKHEFIRSSEPIGLDSKGPAFQDNAEQAIIAPLYHIVTVSWGIENFTPAP